MRQAKNPVSPAVAKFFLNKNNGWYIFMPPIILNATKCLKFDYKQSLHS